MQVSYVVSPKTKGNVQLSQPMGVVGYVGGSVDAVQTARNPVRVSLPSDLKVTVSVLVLVMMLQGSYVCPQCLEMKPSEFSSTQSSLQEVSSRTSKCRNVTFILCPSSTTSVHVYKNTKNIK